MKNNIFPYEFFVKNISEDQEPAYLAIIPAFGNAKIYGSSMQELENAIHDFIDEEIKLLKKQKKNIPKPFNDKYSGKLVIRINPVLHEKLSLESRANKISLNKYIEQKLGSPSL